jgi:hypothetical protein
MGDGKRASRGEGGGGSLPFACNLPAPAASMGKLNGEYFGRSTGVTVEGTSTDIYIPHLFGLIRISFFYRFGTGFQWSCVQIISWSNGYVIVKFGLHNIHLGWKLPPPPQNTSAVVGNLKLRSISVGFGCLSETPPIGAADRSKKET